MIDWPASLPRCFQLGSERYTPPNTALRSDSDQAPGKVRRRFSIGVGALSGSMQMTNAQHEALKTFFVATVASGSLPFEYPRPEEGGTITVRFKDAFASSRLAHDRWRVDLEFEVLP